MPAGGKKKKKKGAGKKAEDEEGAAEDGVAVEEQKDGGTAEPKNPDEEADDEGGKKTPASGSGAGSPAHGASRSSRKSGGSTSGKFSFDKSMMRLRSKSLTVFTEKNPPPARPMILPYIPRKLERGVLENDPDFPFGGSPLLENPKSLGSWRPNPFKGKRYGAGSRPAEQSYEETIKMDPGKELTKKPPRPLKDPPHLCGSTMMSKMSASPKSSVDDTLRKYGAQVDPKRGAFLSFDMRDFPESDEELTAALGDGVALRQERDSAPAFLRDQSRHFAHGLGPFYQKAMGQLEADEAAKARAEMVREDNDEDEEGSGGGRSPASKAQPRTPRSKDLIFLAKSNGKLAKFMGETYYSDRLAGVQGSERPPPAGEWVPRHRALLGPAKMIRGHRGTGGENSVFLAENEPVDPASPPKVLYRGLLNKNEVEDRRRALMAARSAQMMNSTVPAVDYGSFGGGSTNTQQPAKITLWRETEGNWLANSRQEMPPRPQDWRVLAAPEDNPSPWNPPPKGQAKPKVELVSVVDENATAGTREAWARDAIRMMSYREMAKAVRRGDYVGRAQLHDQANAKLAQANAKAGGQQGPRDGAPAESSMAKDGSKKEGRGGVRFDDERGLFDDDGPEEIVEWEGIEKNWLRTRLALTH